MKRTTKVIACGAISGIIAGEVTRMFGYEGPALIHWPFWVVLLPLCILILWVFVWRRDHA